MEAALHLNWAMIQNRDSIRQDINIKKVGPLVHVPTHKNRQSISTGTLLRLIKKCDGSLYKCGD